MPSYVIDPTLLHVPSLVRDLRAFAEEATKVKSLLGARWTRPMAQEQRRHLRLRRRLTELHVLLAASRTVVALGAPPRGLHVLHAPRLVRDLGGPSFDAASWDALAYNRGLAQRTATDYPALAERKVAGTGST